MMEYWVVMDKAELQTALLLLGKMSIPGIVDVIPDVFPEENVLQEMVKKRFFITGESGTVWNPFVKTTLWCAVNAQSELRISGTRKIVLRLYFYDETMVLLVADSESEQYVFYYVPLLPKAIGGLSSNLEKLEAIMPAYVASETHNIPMPLELSLNSATTISALTQALPGHIQNDFSPLTIDGCCLGEHSLERVLIETKECFWLVEKGDDDHALQLTSVGFFNFIESISRWIVRTHGQSIKMKEYTDGSV